MISSICSTNDWGALAISGYGKGVSKAVCSLSDRHTSLCCHKATVTGEDRRQGVSVGASNDKSVEVQPQLNCSTQTKGFKKTFHFDFFGVTLFT